MIFVTNGRDNEKLEMFLKSNGIKFESYDYESEAAIVAELKFAIDEIREDVDWNGNQRLRQVEKNFEHIAKTMMEDNERLFVEITNTVSSYLEDVLNGLSPEIEDATCNGASAL